MPETLAELTTGTPNQTIDSEEELNIRSHFKLCVWAQHKDTLLSMGSPKLTTFLEMTLQLFLLSML